MNLGQKVGRYAKNSQNDKGFFRVTTSAFQGFPCIHEFVRSQHQTSKIPLQEKISFFYLAKNGLTFRPRVIYLSFVRIGSTGIQMVLSIVPSFLHFLLVRHIDAFNHWFCHFYSSRHIWLYLSCFRAPKYNELYETFTKSLFSIWHNLKTIEHRQNVLSI